MHSKTPIVYFDIRVDSPYKDLILIKESQLESPQFYLKGNLVLSISEDQMVKRITLKLIGKFKLDFLQLDHGSGVTNIVKDRKVIFETNWSNLLVTAHGELLNSVDKQQQLNSTMRSLSSPVVNRLMKKKSYTNQVLESPIDGFNGTPFDKLDPEASHLFHLHKGNYELPFDIVLPQDIPDTVEGLQSGSILYHFEAVIERPKTFNFHHHGFTTYKYLRIFRTLTIDHLALQQDVTVGNTYVDKLQYKISLPSKAIPIGGVTPINIELFPFKKGYRLDKITGSLVQFFVIRDSDGNLYDDQIITNKQSMSEFGELPNVEDNILLGNTSISSLFQLPHNLKKITQDMDSAKGLIHIKHKILIQIMLRHVSENKTLEIKANLPVLLYVSPEVKMQGRLVLFDNTNGNIHFRPNEFVDLFETSCSPLDATQASSPSPLTLSLPPPNYQDRLKDCLVNNAVTRSAPVSPHLAGHTRRDVVDYFCPHPPDEGVSPPGENAPDTTSPDTSERLSSNGAPNDWCQVPSYEQTMQEYPAYSPR